MAGRDLDGDHQMVDDAITDEEVEESRPHNHGATLPVSLLLRDFFVPLEEARSKPKSTKGRKPYEIRQQIIDAFIARWRREVGNDIYPLFRLLVPARDRDRGNYNMKESVIANALVSVVGIDKNSDAAQSIINWKRPSKYATSASAGDFAARCYEVISRRAIRQQPGNLLIGEVNDELDRLVVAKSAQEKSEIIKRFYMRMNAEEMRWLIRMIMKDMKMGVTETTLFKRWHSDAEQLFAISSSLKRVCWELHDPGTRLHEEQTDIALMQCFQPQLAQFQLHDLDTIIKKMDRKTKSPGDRDDSMDGGVFWIEEKLDGERMQLHMCKDSSHPGGFRFAFWSRKAKEYTDLYGDGYEDDTAGLTRYLRGAFHHNVKNIILDGEMVVYNMDTDTLAPFGHLKTAANEAKLDTSSNMRPVFRVFDILYFNDMPGSRKPLWNRREALDAAVNDIKYRLEKHPYKKATTKAEIDASLAEVIQGAGEGLVIKNPRSFYAMNERNDDWIKVKPEYMNDFGEDLDVIIIGGYYGRGHRGGAIASFLVGLKACDRDALHGYKPGTILSFCKIGGGMKAEDYKKINELIGHKWQPWDKKKAYKFMRLDPPSRPDSLPEKPDVFIHPADSIVISIKAASVLSPVEEFACGFTLRFPRFKRLREDKNVDSAMTTVEFHAACERIMTKKNQVAWDAQPTKKKIKRAAKVKKEMTVAGVADDAPPRFAEDEKMPIFEGLCMWIMTGESPEQSKKPRSKGNLEALAKAHGAKIFQNAHAGRTKTICIADRRQVQVQGLQNKGNTSILRSSWLLDCIRQAEIDAQNGCEPLLLPFEPRHAYFVAERDAVMIAAGADEFGDGFSRDFQDVEELRQLFDSIVPDVDEEFDGQLFNEQLEQHGHSWQPNRGDLFQDCVVAFAGWKPAERDAAQVKLEVKEEPFDQDAMPISTPPAASDVSSAQEDNTEHSIPHDKLTAELASHRIRFGGGRVEQDWLDREVTHIVLTGNAYDKGDLRRLRGMYSTRKRIPQLVTAEWISECWNEITLLDEERYKPAA